MKKARYKITAVLLSVLIGIFAITNDGLRAKAAMTIHSLTFSNKIAVKTLFYPYRNSSTVTNLNDIRSLQGIAVDQYNNMYLTYATGDKTTYGYIYKYSPKGVLLKKSARLTIGHGQAIAYKSGYLYQLADVKGQESYTLQKINPSTLTVVRKWKVPTSIHPNVVAMLDSNTAVAVSKSGDGYDINKIHLGSGTWATRDWREKIHISGMIGTTSGKPIQGFAYGNGKYYLLSNGEYMTFDKYGKNKVRVKLNTTREPEGITINSAGKILIQFNKLNEVFIQR
ncbi:hypothetical protein AM500_01980 [Bacillus sp. FJAT-18017]|uniref:hypothetical protein n=1 Tax=Bacillus sp. FJAT-18017 TaxID=1705566 RepID=UPI0006ADCB26|nr:hypothetical protein [Bacillus sp. FJAT-18017]ALC88704.1 hypothetical protein AM500_01980 [Bacillus sp. FJAT-18017]